LKSRPTVELSYSALDLVLIGISIIGVLLSILPLLLHFTALPEVLPVHFDASGNPNGYGDKNLLFTIPIINLALLVGLEYLARMPHHHNYMVEITPENASAQYHNSSLMLRFLTAINCLFFSWIVTRTLLISQTEVDGLGIYSVPLFLLGNLGGIVFFMIRSARLKT
jgi:uncharacterized membrane protein